MNHRKGKTDRESYILKTLSQRGNVRIFDLSNTLGVSRETIRRDLKDLEDRGVLHYTHGGATLDVPANNHYEASSAHSKYSEEKNAIGKKAAEFIKDYEAVIILGSTTTERLGPYLSDKNYITVITNSFAIAQNASQNPTNTVIMLGGEYNTALQATTGIAAANFLENYRADRLFFCPSGVSCQYGVTNLSESDTLVIKSALPISKSIILLSDYSKFWTVGLHKICDIENIDIIISDSCLSKRKIDELTAQNVQVVIANGIEESLNDLVEQEILDHLD